MDSTVVNFWTMIWEKKSHVIVMLSLLRENGLVITYNKSTLAYNNGLCLVQILNFFIVVDKD